MATKAETWAIAICNALDLDPSMIVRLEIVLEVNNVAYLQIRAYPRNSDAIIELLRKTGKEVQRITVSDASPEEKSFGDDAKGRADHRDQFLAELKTRRK